MRLPPLDEYRQPLVEPLGHLVLQAAYLDNALYSFVAMLWGPQVGIEDVANRLRNWDPGYITAAVDDAIEDQRLAGDLKDYVSRIGRARDQRHRMIHDAMEVGVDDSSGRYRIIILREGYVRHSKGMTEHRFVRVEPEEVAALAMEFYELRIEIDTFMARWRSLSS